MNVTSKISVDLTRQNVGQRVNAVQGDGNTRLVEITLLSGGSPWTPPEGVEAAIAYRQPSGTKGLYNKLADGTAAISISGNVATIILAPHMLTESRTVQALLVFNDAQLNRLTTFPFEVSVTSNPAAGAQKVEDYIRLQWLEDKLEEYLAAIKASGAFNGAPGVPGLSPTVAVNDITGGHRITITDAEGDKTVDVMDGAQGVPGHTPEYGVDYGTPEQISGIAQQAAEILQPDLNQIKDDLTDLAPAGAAVGQLFRVAAVSKDGKYTMEPVDMPAGGITDVIIKDKSIVTEGVALIPLATDVVPGVVRLSPSMGIAYQSNGVAYVSSAGKTHIDGRIDFKPITPHNMDYAVKAAMCDGKGAAWTAEEQAAAQQRLGLDKEWVKVGEINNDNKAAGISVDLTGCTQLYVRGRGTTTGNVTVSTNISWLIYNPWSNGYMAVYGEWHDNMDGFAAQYLAKSSNATSAIALSFPANIAYSCIDGRHIADITRFSVSNVTAITDISLEFYAR